MAWAAVISVLPGVAAAALEAACGFMGCWVAVWPAWAGADGCPGAGAACGREAWACAPEMPVPAAKAGLACWPCAAWD